MGVSGGRSSRTNTVIRTANTPSENILSRSGDAFGWDTGLPYRCPEMLYLRLRRDDHMLLRDAKEIVAGVGAKGVCKLVDGANHFYNRHTRQIVEIINEWLVQFND